MVSIRIRRLYRRSYEDIPQTLFQRQRFVGKRQKTYWPCPPHSDFATIPNFIFPSHFSTANGKTSILRTLELPGRYLPREYLLITGMKNTTFRIFTQEKFPGWCKWIHNGETTLLENFAGLCSHSHVMFGDLELIPK